MAPDVPLVHIRDRASKVPPERFPELHLPGAPGSRRDRGFRFPDEQGQVLSHHEARKEEESKKRKPFPAHGPHYEPDLGGITIWPDLMPSSSWKISFLRQYPSERPPTYTVFGHALRQDLCPRRIRKVDARRQRATLQRIARLAMLERGMLPDFSTGALEELARIKDPPVGGDRPVHDLRNLLWASIDNDDSRDLDQLSVAETLPGGAAKVLVAIADVDSLVKKGSAIDEHARQNTTSVYTAGEIFPMLPERLSTDLTSLGFQEDRMAIVIEMVFGENGSFRSSDLYGATVRNRAKLAYNSVAAWLEGKGPAPGPIEGVEGLAENLRIQDRVAQQLKAF